MISSNILNLQLFILLLQLYSCIYYNSELKTSKVYLVLGLQFENALRTRERHVLNFHWGDIYVCGFVASNVT
jgi:hypothetical protein